MMIAVYGLWIIALIIAIRLGLTLFYQWKYKDVVSINSRKQKQLIARSVSPLIVVLLLSLSLQTQLTDEPQFGALDFRTIHPQKANENLQVFVTQGTDEFEVKGKVVVEENGVEVTYFVVTIRGVQYLIENPNE